MQPKYVIQAEFAPTRLWRTAKREKHQKPNSDYGLHKHFALLPIAIESMAIGNTRSERKTLSFSQHARIQVNINMKTKLC